MENVELVPYENDCIVFYSVICCFFFALISVYISVNYQVSRCEHYIFMIRNPVILFPFLTFLFQNKFSRDGVDLKTTRVIVTSADLTDFEYFLKKQMRQIH